MKTLYSPFKNKISRVLFQKESFNKEQKDGALSFSENDFSADEALYDLAVNDISADTDNQTPEKKLTDWEQEDFENFIKEKWEGLKDLYENATMFFWSKEKFIKELLKNTNKKTFTTEDIEDHIVMLNGYASKVNKSMFAKVFNPEWEDAKINHDFTSLEEAGVHFFDIDDEGHIITRPLTDFGSKLSRFASLFVQTRSISSLTEYQMYVWKQIEAPTDQKVASKDTQGNEKENEENEEKKEKELKMPENLRRGIEKAFQKETLKEFFGKQKEKAQKIKNDPLLSDQDRQKAWGELYTIIFYYDAQTPLKIKYDFPNIKSSAFIMKDPVAYYENLLRFPAKYSLVSETK